MIWKILKTGKRSAEENMSYDEKLLKSLSPGDSPILHFYEWEKESGTYGYFIHPKHYLNLKEVEKLDIDLARRPTGGGIVFHLTDLAFSVLIPSSFPSFSLNPLDNYHFINSKVKQAVKSFLKEKAAPELLSNPLSPLDANCSYFCMAHPTQYDVMMGPYKIAGSAQRKRKEGYLHQGSITLAFPKEGLLDRLLLPGTKVHEAMNHYTLSLLGSDWTLSDLKEARHQMQSHLEKALIEELAP